MISIRGFFLVAVILIQTAAAGVSARAETEYSKVVYNEKTKSYFRYIKYDVFSGMSWPKADSLARSQVYKGVRGRLAIVPDEEVNSFLRRTFNPDTEVWIGLRYSCRHKRLLWVGGQIVDRAGYQNWARPWYRNADITCKTQSGRMDFMPVYYTTADKGFRWQASGSGKGFFAYFVEFPTGTR